MNFDELTIQPHMLAWVRALCLILGASIIVNGRLGVDRIPGELEIPNWEGYKVGGIYIVLQAHQIIQYQHLLYREE